MRPRGSPEELERRRRRAIDLLKAGASVTDVARRLGCSHSSVILWRDAVRRRGPTALQAKPAAGRPPKLSARQRARLPRLLLRGAGAWGFETDLWTTRRIATVIRREFGVPLHRAHVGRVLASLGWSCQKPERRAIERDEAAIDRWKRYRWTAIKKRGAPEGPPGLRRRVRVPLDSQRPPDVGPAGPDAHRPAPLSARQDLRDLGDHRERPAASGGTLRPFASQRKPQPRRGRDISAGPPAPAPRPRRRRVGWRQHPQGPGRSSLARTLPPAASGVVPGLRART
jgi:transposase